MMKDEYREWLKGTMKAASIKDRISRCNRVEKVFNIDLDAEYEKDGGERVMEMLTYTIHDLRSKRKVPAGFVFKEGADVNRRLADLRCAVNKYFIFRNNNNTKR